MIMISMRSTFHLSDDYDSDDYDFDAVDIPSPLTLYIFDDYDVDAVDVQYHLQMGGNVADFYLFCTELNCTEIELYRNSGPLGF